MSEFRLFLKQNKKQKQIVEFPVTKSLVDENGKVLLWKIKPLSSREVDEIQEECLVDVESKNNTYRQKIDPLKYVKKLVVKSIIYPDLKNAELQDSYGVKSEEDLIQEMVNDVGEWNKLVNFINDFNDLSGLNEEIEKAKN